MTNVPAKGPGLDSIHPIRSSKKPREKHTNSTLQPDLNTFAHVLHTFTRDVHTGYAKRANAESLRVEVRNPDTRMLRPASDGPVGTSKESALSFRGKRLHIEAERVSQGHVEAVYDSSKHALKLKEPYATSMQVSDGEGLKDLVGSTISTNESRGNLLLSRLATTTYASSEPATQTGASRGRDAQEDMSTALNIYRGLWVISGLERNRPSVPSTESSEQENSVGFEGDGIPVPNHPESLRVLTGPASDGNAKSLLDEERNARFTLSQEKSRNVLEKGQVDANAWESYGPLYTHQALSSGSGQGLQEPLATVDTLRSTAYQDLSNLIASHTRSGSYEITVRVQPEGMGNIFISVSKETQGLLVSITADHPQTLQWMESGKHEVMQALQSLGVDVASVQLNLSQSGAFHQSFANQSHQSHGQSQHLVIDETSRGNPASDEAGPSTVAVSDFRHHDWRATTISVQV